MLEKFKAFLRGKTKKERIALRINEGARSRANREYLGKMGGG